MKALFILNTDAHAAVYGPDELTDIQSMADIYAPQLTSEAASSNPEILNQAEVIFSGWGGPRIDAEFLAHAPNLRAVFYGAGSIKGIVTDDFWQRGIVITSAYAANAVPVAEFTISQIIFCLKQGWHHALSIKRTAQYPTNRPVIGAFGTTVGIISLGMIGKLVCEMLKPFDVNVIAYDPFATPATAQSLGIKLVSLEDLFAQSDVVSLHTPWLPETEGMIRAEHFHLMKPNASFINTSRGAIVNEPEMISALELRPDIQAVLDVTFPEPPEPASKLYILPNVVLTPHIAGSLGNECRRMGRYMVDELRRYTQGQPLRWQITREQAAKMA